jgi:hypothetical protein
VLQGKGGVGAGIGPSAIALTLESDCSSKFSFCVSAALPDALSSPM